MGGVFRALMNLPMFRSALRPITRVLVGVIAIPVFRFVMRRLFRLQDLDDELEKDLEQWFRGALLLLAASANMEHLLFGWMSNVDWLERADWLTMGLRLMLAIGVIEAMPDQELFAVIHPGPPKLEGGGGVPGMIREFWIKKWLFVKGAVCQHLNRSSPVLAMMCAIVGAELPELTETQNDLLHYSLLADWSCTQVVTGISLAGPVAMVGINAELLPELNASVENYRTHWERWMVGWGCYLAAITQYLIIGLVTSRDRAMDVLSEFDRAVAERRKELIQEFQLDREEEAVPDADASESNRPSEAASMASESDKSAEAGLPSESADAQGPKAKEDNSETEAS